jgi:hypothetical protein
MDKEALAQTIFDALEDQAPETCLYLLSEKGLREVIIDSTVDLLALAEFIIGRQNQPSHPNLIKEVVSCPSKKLVKIIWGDDVVTYAHYTKEAELVHRMGLCMPTKRIGKSTPDEAIAY